MTLHRGVSRSSAILAVIAPAGTILLAWVQPQASGDLFIAFAGGRDVLRGLLGSPDTWAFTTSDRVWINQNWGSHLLLSHAGLRGLLALKGGILLALTALVGIGLRRRGVRTWVAADLAAASFLACYAYLDLRPHLLGLVCIPALLLTVTKGLTRGTLPWPALLILVVWANIHGSFVLGLAILALWFAVLVAFDRDRPRSLVWRAAGVLLGTCLVTCVASPFGLRNVAQVFAVTNPVWRSINEWQSLFSERSLGFLPVWPFVAFVVIVASLVALAVRARHVSGQALAPPLVAFDLGIAIAGIAMAIVSRRFIPTAVIMVVLSAGPHIDRLLRDSRLVALAVPIVIVVLTLAAAQPLTRYYAAANPLYPSESFASRLFGSRAYAPDVVTFAASNGLRGRVFNAWIWEGLTRWHAPELQVFIGGRAQQIYDVATYERYDGILHAPDGAAAQLRQLGVSLVLVPADPEHGRLVVALENAPDARWVYLYAYGGEVLLGDAGDPAIGPIVDAACRGDLHYPSAAARSSSRAMCLASPTRQSAPEAMRNALVAANDGAVAGLAYATLGDLALAGAIDPTWCREYFTREWERLTALDVWRPDGADVVDARRVVARTLAALDQRAGDPALASRFEIAASDADRQLQDMVAEWGR